MPKVDFAYTAEEQKARDEEMKPSADWNGPKYPYGLTMNLNPETLAKLGKSARDFRVGEEMDVRVTLRVTEVSAREMEDGEESRVDVLMTSMEVPSSDDARAKKLFGDEG